jgi:serine/threonine-protein kinase RsbW
MVNPAFCPPAEMSNILGEDGRAWEIIREFESCLEAIGPVCERIQSYCEARSNADSAVPLLGADINLVLTELLTNIVLHAYDRRMDGGIELRARFVGQFLELLIVDQGIELPKDLLEKKPVEFDGEDFFGLPEGGFGWCIVHAIIDEIEYQRIDSSNRLLLRKNIFFNRGE